jgi:dihydroxyacetone kinase-like protein
MKALALEFWLQVVQRLAEVFAKNELRLCGLDGATGDGDHGTSMLLGFSQAQRSLAERPPGDIGELFRRMGEAFITNVGGVTGVIFGSMFAALGESSADAQKLYTDGIHRMFAAGLMGVENRGKVKEGDKSLVDALSPAVIALALAVEKRQDPQEALEFASQAAAAGLEATRIMEAKVGRARYQRGKAVGHLDAGAASISLIFEVLASASE